MNNQKIYEGEYRNDLRHGKGVAIFEDNVVFEGIYNCGSFESGRLDIDGNVYEGTFENNLFHGNGTFCWKNGDKYEGEFCNGAITGRGILGYWDGTIYVGELVDGYEHGHGVIYFTDGTKFEGIFEHGSPKELPDQNETSDNSDE